MADLHAPQTAAQQSEDGVVVTIYQPDGEPYRAKDGSVSTVTVLGSEAQRVRDAQDAVTRKLMQRRRLKPSPDDLRANRVAVAAAAVIDWHGWEENDEPVACTPERVRGLLAVEHILVQVEDAVQAHADFLPTGSPNSAIASDTTPD